jgi:hypothetical protein
MVQVVAHLVAADQPVEAWPAKHGPVQLVVSPAATTEGPAVADRRKRLENVYGEAVAGTLGPEFGRGLRGPRRFAESAVLDFESRAGRSWLLFQLETWIDDVVLDEDEDEEADDERRSRLDPAREWRRERWVPRRTNERSAALFDEWSRVIAPEDPTMLTLADTPAGGQFAEIRLGRINAFSRPA